MNPIFLLLVGTPFLVGQDPVPPQKASESIVVAEADWAHFYDEPAHHFARAVEDLSRKHGDMAADEILVAASYLRMRGRSVTLEDSKQALSDAVLRLERLAQRVRNGDEKSIRVLDQEFGFAEAALARDAILEAKEHAEAGSGIDAGYNLVAGAFQLEHGAAWLGLPLSVDEREMLARDADLGQRLEDGGALDVTKVEVATDDLERTLGRVDGFMTTLGGGVMPASVTMATSEWMGTGAESWILVDQEPQVHENLAIEKFLDKDYPGAAAEIAKVASWLRTNLSVAAKAARHDMDDSVKELDALANSVSAGTVKSVDSLENAFARGERAMAENHQAMAVLAWADTDSLQTARHLRAAVRHVEQALALSRRELGEGVAKTFKGIDSVAARLTDGEGWIPDEVDQALAAVGNEISQLKEQLKTS